MQPIKYVAAALLLVSAMVMGAGLACSSGPMGSPASDREALVALYHATNGADWSNNTNWLSPAPIDEWHGVRVDDNGRVAGLGLTINRLVGGIPAELGKLSNLKWLTLGGNQLSGEIPPELGNLSNLEWLFLDNNRLSGKIPAELGNLSNLRFQPAIPVLPLQPVKRGDTGGTRQPFQPAIAVARQQPVEWEHTGGTRQPLQPGMAVARRQSIEREDTGGTRQPL